MGIPAGARAVTDVPADARFPSGRRAPGLRARRAGLCEGLTLHSGSRWGGDGYFRLGSRTLRLVVEARKTVTIVFSLSALFGFASPFWTRAKGNRFAAS
jgi:hypothetical protein